MTAQDWIRHLNLAPHPEGGYYRETYRSTDSIPVSCLPPRFRGPRSMCTGIYFLLARGQVSHLHRIQSDELWHAYAGGGIVLHQISPEGAYSRQHLGRNPRQEEQPQIAIPAGTWFGATLAPRANYALVGCTVAPGFDFADFELGSRSRLEELYPQHNALIRQLTADPISPASST